MRKVASFSHQFMKTLYLGVAILAPQTAKSNSCDAILVHGLRNISVSKNSEALTTTNYFNHCQRNLDQMSDQVMARAEVEIFGSGSGGGSFDRQQSRTRIDNWCTTNASTAQQNRNSYQENQTFYQGAVSAWEACVRLDSRDITINPIISPDRRTVDIGIVYRGPGSSGVRFTGLPVEGFSCRITRPNGEPENFPIELNSQSVQARCTRNTPTEQSLNNVQFSVLPRGTISVQTTSDPFQLFFAEEWTPPAPLREIERLQAAISAAELPVGTIISSILTPDQFMSPSNPNYREGKWILADGRPLPLNSRLRRITGEINSPNTANIFGDTQFRRVITATRRHGENVQQLQSEGLTWTWFASANDIQGNALNQDDEQDEDHFMVSIDQNGVVTAQGRTYNRKARMWGPWRGGIANVLGIGVAPSRLYHYIRID